MALATNNCEEAMTRRDEVLANIRALLPGDAAMSAAGKEQP